MTVLAISLLSMLGAAVVSLLITDFVHRYALERKILDVPNERSLHSNPTPRGGGIGIAAIAFSTAAILAINGQIEVRAAVGLIVGGAAVAAVGWIDDRRQVSAFWRGLIHFCAAAFAVYCFGGFPSLITGNGILPLGWTGSALAIIGLVWLINLYNFMDGADGIAATEAVTVFAVGGAILVFLGVTGLGVLSLVICGASIGFLLRNLPPARIFMGDVSSGLLGFLLGSIAILSERTGRFPLIGWMILLGVFVADATFTLIRRFSRGERWYSAHRTHAYQRLAQAGWSHARIVRSVALVNIVLAMLVLAVVVRPALLLPCLLLSVLFLATLYVRVERVAPFPDAHER
jgi:Fuc2NAc and GlcNAc transferase